MTLDDLADRTFDAVLFDNDGTLIDSTPAVERAWLQWSREFGVEPRGLTGFHGVTAADIVRSVAPHADQVAALARIVELETSDVHDVVALPGAIDALEAVHDRAAIATSATNGLAVARISAAGLPMPRVLVTADDVHRGKPDPEPFLVAAKRLGVVPGRCLVVEDAPAGLAAAKAAGCASLAVLTTGRREELSDADAIVSTLAEVRFEVGADGIRALPADG